MKTFRMVFLTNVLFLLIVALIALAWPVLGQVSGHGNSWWVAPLAIFAGFVMAGWITRDIDLDRAAIAQFAVFGLFCLGTLLWSLLIESLGIPAWRIALTLVLTGLAIGLARVTLRRMKA